MVSSLVPVPIHQYLYLTSCFLFSSWIGILSLITLGGLGVRDGVLFLALQPLMPGPAAAAVALLARFWTTICELLSAGIAWIVNRMFPARE